MTVAETTVDADRNSAAYAGFRLLTGYIFGGNAKKQKIDMTAPVIEARSEYTLPTQAPGRGWVIRFVMPRGFSVANLPKPETEGIVLREEPPAHMAVLKFSGLAGDDAVAAKTAELQAMLKARNLNAERKPRHCPVRSALDASLPAPQRDHDPGAEKVRRDWVGLQRRPSSIRPAGRDCCQAMIPASRRPDSQPSRDVARVV
jgi:SOUL heme-binding protein